MSLLLAFSVALMGLSIISGMLGMGVALVAVPVLSLGLDDLVNQVHPLGLILNGVTALFSAFAFARAGLVQWPRAFALAAAASVSAPLGSLAARVAPEWLVWTLYFSSVILLLYRIHTAPVRAPGAAVNLKAILLWALPASALSGFLGVGPGFLLVLLMIHFGIGIREAAATSAAAVAPASFAAAAPHLAHMTLAPSFVLTLCAASAVGALVGARLASRNVSPTNLQRLFVVTIVITSAVRALHMLF